MPEGYNLEQLSTNLLNELDAYIKNNFERLIKQFVHCFSGYCRKIGQMQQDGLKGAAAYLHFSLLNTNLLLRKAELRMDVYDKNWYVDDAECSGSFAVKELFRYLFLFADAVENLREKSPWTVSILETQERILEESRKYLFFLFELIRLGMKEAVKEPEYQKIIREPVFSAYIGGYMDRADVLYREDSTVKDSGEVRRQLGLKERTLFSHEFYQSLNLTKGDYDGLRFLYSSFDGSDFTNSSLQKSKFLFSSLKAAVFKDVNFMAAELFDVDLSGAVLENVSFSKAKLNHVSFHGAKLKNVDFTDALLLEQLDFQNAVLLDTKLPESR